MKLFLPLLMLLIPSFTPTELDQKFWQSWSFTETVNYRQGLEITNQYTLRFNDSKTGSIHLFINCLEEDNTKISYQAFCPFSYVLNNGEKTNTPEIEVKYESLNFKPVPINRLQYDKRRYPENLQTHLKELEYHFTDLKESYILSLEPPRNLVVKGFSNINSSSYVTFRSNIDVRE